MLLLLLTLLNSSRVETEYYTYHITYLMEPENDQGSISLISVRKCHMHSDVFYYFYGSDNEINVQGDKQCTWKRSPAKMVAIIVC